MQKSLLKHIVALLFLMALTSCKDEDRGTFQKCDISTCAGKPAGEYCLFGYKWGDGNPLANSGVAATGPGIPGGILTFGYYSEGALINTHSQNDVRTLSFDLLTCDVDSQIRSALTVWSSVADIDFQATLEVESADIRFALAHIDQGGLGYPAFTDGDCSPLAGLVVLNTRRPNCTAFYNLVLHEIGHVLGLGHVGTDNIMNPDFDQSSTSLGEGDIEGIQSIYGTK